MDYKLELAKIIANALQSDTDTILQQIEVPPNPQMGDFAFPCFRLAKELRKAPQMIATDLQQQINAPFIDEVQTQGAYVNVFVNKQQYIKNVLTQVLTDKEDFGNSNHGQGKMIVLDYSSPNIAKPFHVGHLRSTVIGNALKNVYAKLGYETFGINYLGDWGTQFGKLIVAYKKWGSKEEVEAKGIEELTRIYVKFHDEAEKDDSLNDEARAWLVKMQEGDTEALSLWRWFKDISMVEFNKIYKRLNITFDSYDGESFFNDKMMPVVDELRDKDLLVESNGAQIVDLTEYNMPPCLILRSDGGTLYPTRDIAAAIYRHNTYDFHKAIYITAIDQKLHFEQWFKVIDLMGYEWADKLTHASFGLVSLETGKLSTRKGNVVLMEDLLDEAVAKTLNIIEQKNPNLQDKEKVAEQVGIGAIIFNDLYNGRIKDVTFSWDRMLNFDGETAPYVQYTYARACSVIRKAEKVDLANIDYSLIVDDNTLDLIKLFDTYNDKLLECIAKDEPFVVTRHIVEIAKAFNKFYHDNVVLVDDEELKKARLAVVVAVHDVLKSGLTLLGIQAPTQM